MVHITSLERWSLYLTNHLSSNHFGKISPQIRVQPLNRKLVSRKNYLKRAAGIKLISRLLKCSSDKREQLIQQRARTGECSSAF